MSQLAVILVRPAKAANVGAAARAMKNFGFRDLRVVGGDHALVGGDEHGEARALAWNADDVLEGARRFDTLEEATADLALTAATSGMEPPRGETLTPATFATEARSLGGEEAVGLVFGPETHGLTGFELDRCRVRVRIPTEGEQPSLNLAQAVVTCCYEMARSAEPAAHPAGVDPPAPEAELQRLHDKARDLLLKAGYLNPQEPEHVLGELRRLLARARPSRRELTLLLGLVAQLDWAQREKP
ncbi:MAG: TrmH family RNA methyltransferase [Acidobacteriota bacterium]